MAMIDEAEIQRTISALKPDGELFEVRVIPANKKDKPYVGYFTDADTLIRELRKVMTKGANVYITLQVINEACYSREQRDTFIRGANTTSDIDIDGYEWLMIDLDPIRPSRVSSSDAELQAAKELGNIVYKYLADLGFEKPLTAFSGNGVHLLYKIELANTKEREALIEKCLQALDIMFSNEKVKIDKTNSNPSRICKLYGTLAQKGSNTEIRPHRMSRMLSKATEYKTTDIQFLEKLAATIPPEPEKTYTNYGKSDFDLEDFLFRNGLNYNKVNESEYTKYVLEECPFDSSHKAPDSSIFRMRNGAIGFHCFHNSCYGKTWKDVRIKYEPDAYERKEQYENKKLFGTFKRNEPKEPPKIVENEIPTEFTPAYMKSKPKEHKTYIKTGINDFDRQYIGLEKKRVTLLSGYAGGAKSTLLSQIMVNAVNEGNRVYCFSGELDPTDLYSWLMLQAAGKNNTEEFKPGFYKPKDEVRDKILDWLNDKFWLYNNDKGYNFQAIREHLIKRIRELKIDLLCIDNLMALDITDLADSKNDQQKKFLWEIHELAIKENIHVIVVCHPKKPVGLLTMYDVSGASEIVNTADNILYVYRVNQQFKNAYASLFGHSYDAPGTNCWHMAKARHGSLSEDYFPLYYEVETKRLKNSLVDMPTYGWDNDFRTPEQWELQF